MTIETKIKPTALILPELQAAEYPGARVFKVRVLRDIIEAYDPDMGHWFAPSSAEIDSGLLLDDHGANLVELAMRTRAADELETALERLRDS